MIPISIAVCGGRTIRTVGTQCEQYYKFELTKAVEPTKGTLWRGTVPWVMGIFSIFVYTLPLVLFLIFLPEAIWGITLALILGSTVLIVTSFVLGVIVLLGFLLSLGNEKLALYDRLAETEVI